MLSDRAYRFMGVYVKCVSYMGILPFDWCKKRSMLIPSKRAEHITLVNTLLHMMWCSFASLQLVRFYVENEFEKFNLTLMNGFAALVCLESMCLFTFKPDECRNLANSVFFYLKHINSK